MKLSMKIRAHEAEVLVVGAEEEQTAAEIIRIILPGCTAEVRRSCARSLSSSAWMGCSRR